MTKIAIPEGTQTKFFFLGDGILTDVASCLREAFPGKQFWLVADENTWAAAGAKVSESLEREGLLIGQAHIYPGHPIMHASEELAQALYAEIPEDCVPVAIGSGTINDIVKRASGLKQLRYCCLATACSVDGYTSSGAALLVTGFKKTMPCPPPYAVIADSQVLATAPAPMFAAGYSDLMAKVYGGADWVIADELGIEPISEVPWNLVHEHLMEWLDDGNNMGNIFHGLCNTGYSMQIYQESRPASGAEHLFSHIWEMEKLQYQGDTVSHGFQVAVGMLLSAQLMDFLVKTPLEEAKKMALPLQSWSERQADIEKLLEKGCYGNAFEVAKEKFLEGEAADARRQFIFAHWEMLRQRVKKEYLPVEELKRKLKQFDCPSSHVEIGLSNEQFLHAVPVAQLIRKRYTILDVLYESGLLPIAMRSIKLDEI